MKILILSSSSRHFPLDIEATLKEAGLESNRLQSLNEFIASPLRREPFLAILEVGSTEDIDRALLAYEWAETVQPLAAARYLLLVGSKHISLQEKSSRFRGVEVAQLPLPTKNLMFKVELQLKVLNSESKAKTAKKANGFSAEIREVERERVMVIKGPGPGEGGWKNSGDAPQGRIRWRWIDDPPKKGKTEEKFSWSAESKTAPIFNSDIEAWEVKDPEADLQCHRDGKEVFSAKKAEAGKGSGEGAVPSAPMTPDQVPEASGAPAESKPASTNFAGTTPASAKNNLVTAATPATDAPAQPASSPAGPKSERASSAHFAREQHTGVSPAQPASTNGTQADDKKTSPGAAAPETKIAEKPAPPATTPVAPASAPARTELPKIDAISRPEASAALPKLGGEASNTEKKSGSPMPATSASTSPTEKRTEPNQPPAPDAPTPTTEKPKTQTSAPANSPLTDAEKPVAASSPAPSGRTGSPPPGSTLPPSAPTAPATPTASPGTTTQTPPRESNPSAEPARQTPPTTGAKTSAPATSSPEKNSATIPSLRGNNETPKPAPTTEHQHSRTLRTEVIRTIQERPAEPGRDTTTEFPEKTKEITGKIVIPTEPERSDHQNLVRSSGEQDSSERNVISSSARPAEEDQHLKTRLFLTLSLEELQDQNSTWIPVEGYRIYLSARHRYYGLRELDEVFPLWIYEGELPPEFLDLQKAWKFYDRLPNSFGSMDTLPAPVARYLIEMKGAKPETKADASAIGKDGNEAGKSEAESSPEAGAKYIAGAKGTGDIVKPIAAKPAALSPAWFLELVSRLLGR